MPISKTTGSHRSRVCPRQILAVVWVVAIAVSLPAEAKAQGGPVGDAGRLQVSRTDLEQLVKQLEESAQSSSYSEEFKQRARSQAEAVNRRLREGDFQVGDQIHISIEGEDSIPIQTVAPGRVLVLRNFGELSLEGVLRSELTTKVSSHIVRFIRNPVVRTQSLIRLAVTGSVGKPGFHLIPAETPLPDAIMIAGGPALGAKLENLRIQRAGERIWEGSLLQRAIADGQTLDQMSLRSGDEISLPGQAEAGSGRLLRVLSIASGVVLGIVALMRGR